MHLVHSFGPPTVPNHDYGHQQEHTLQPGNVFCGLHQAQQNYTIYADVIEMQADLNAVIHWAESNNLAKNLKYSDMALQKISNGQQLTKGQRMIVQNKLRTLESW